MSYIFLYITGLYILRTMTNGFYSQAAIGEMKFCRKGKQRMEDRDDKARQGEERWNYFWRRFVKFFLVSRLSWQGEEIEKRNHSSSLQIIQIVEYLLSSSRLRRGVEKYRNAVSRIV